MQFLTNLRFRLDSSYLERVLMDPVRNTKILEQRLEFYFQQYWLPKYENICAQEDFHPLLVYHYFRLENLAPKRLDILHEFSDYASYKLNVESIIQLYGGNSSDYSMNRTIGEDEITYCFLTKQDSFDLMLLKIFLNPKECEKNFELLKKSYMKKYSDHEDLVTFKNFQTIIYEAHEKFENEFQLFQKQPCRQPIQIQSRRQSLQIQLQERARTRPSRRRKTRKKSNQSRRQRCDEETFHQEEAREVHETVLVEDTTPHTPLGSGNGRPFRVPSSALIIGGASILFVGAVLWHFFFHSRKHKP